ncbi:MAG TPA: four helix bundle protein [Thermoanaerobaculia bacterium]|nr:four helix bundle protein [Thermoanaerobaculia bacterium]
MQSFRDLKVWQAGMTLTVSIYELTANFPKSEVYGLMQQMRRAAVSIPSNIAEGYGRRTAKQRYNFLENALGSVFELETQLDLSFRLSYITPDQFDSLSSAIRNLGRGLSALMRYVENEARAQPARHSIANPPEELRGTPRNPRN